MSVQYEAGKLWVISRVTDAKDETINTHVERNRVGKKVKNLFPLEVAR